MAQRGDSGSERSRKSRALRDSGAAKRSPGGDLLVGDSSRAILAKISDGDPLGMLERCQARVREHAVLLDGDRLISRALARTAYTAFREGAKSPLSEWIEAQIDRSIEELVVEDDEEERGGRVPVEANDPRYAFIAEALGVTPAVARKACVVFNHLPRAVRRAYWAIAVDGKSVFRYVAEGFGPPALVEERVKRALTAFSLLRDPGGTDALDPSLTGRSIDEERRDG